jgi:2,4-dienoyl-CoA reductase-like NADH-dependent reductase (Old Yellow Enzyme family)
MLATGLDWGATLSATPSGQAQSEMRELMTPQLFTPLTLGPGYQVPLAAKVRRESGMLTRAVGLIADPHQAEAVLVRGEADQVALARAFLDNPRWGWHAAETLGVELAYPPQYARAKAGVWPGARIARPVEDSPRERRTA